MYGRMDVYVHELIHLSMYVCMYVICSLPFQSLELNGRGGGGSGLVQKLIISDRADGGVLYRGKEEEREN